MTDTIPMQEHVEKMLLERDKRYTQAIEQQQAALTLAKTELERRLEGLNELRKEVLSDRTQFIRQDTYYTKMSSVDSWMVNTNKQLTIMETRHVTWTTVIGIFFVVVQIVLHYWK